LSKAKSFIRDDDFPFQFPLVDDRIYSSAAPFMTPFAKYARTTRGFEYHAAEDILQPAGTTVYAMADGAVSFSGPMGGYGWLVIINHPQANLYSLYGHLSPSRWQIEPRLVEKGELIGYLGDPDENGGSEEHPMRPHLHLGMRVGQRVDYPGMGQWRWQAGWIKPCPQDLGWLQPSLIITNQDIPVGGFNDLTGGFVTKWWIDLLFAGFYVFGGACLLVYAIKRDKPLVLFFVSVVFLAVGFYFSSRGGIVSYATFAMAALFVLTGIYKLIFSRSSSRA